MEFALIPFDRKRRNEQVEKVKRGNSRHHAICVIWESSKNLGRACFFLLTLIASSNSFTTFRNIIMGFMVMHGRLKRAPVSYSRNSSVFYYQSFNTITNRLINNRLIYNMCSDFLCFIDIKSPFSSCHVRSRRVKL